MNPQTAARATGVLFLITFVTSIPALLLLDPVLKDSRYVLGPGADNHIFLSATLELLLIVANVGTALTLFPVLKCENECLALGYVAARIVECVFIAVGILCVLAVVSLRQNASGTDPDALVAMASALVAVKNWSFLLGPGFVVGIGNGIMLGYLMYRTGLVPRGMAIFGLVGGPLVSISGVAVMFGLLEPGGVFQFMVTIPEIIWELSLGIYLTIKGFRSAPILTQTH